MNMYNWFFRNFTEAGRLIKERDTARLLRGPVPKLGSKWVHNSALELAWEYDEETNHDSITVIITNISKDGNTVKYKYPNGYLDDSIDEISLTADTRMFNNNYTEIV